MSTFLHKIVSWFNKPKQHIADKTACAVSVNELFHPKYKTILHVNSLLIYSESFEWINLNSRYLVDIQWVCATYINGQWVVGGEIEETFIGFEDESDAFIFKLKFL